MQIALQANAASLSTGRYAYTVNIYDMRSGVPTTFTYSDTATVINDAADPTFGALAAGWTISGLEKLYSASGGVILDEGNGFEPLVHRQLWLRRRNVHEPGRRFLHAGHELRRIIYTHSHEWDDGKLQLGRILDVYR